MANFCFL
jgi:uncharacterized coiled-coil protein SlyX